MINDYDKDFLLFLFIGRWFEIKGLNPIFAAYREIKIDTNSLSGITKTAINPYELISVDNTWLKQNPKYQQNDSIR